MDAKVRAEELFNNVMGQVKEARDNLAKRMLEKGMTPETHYIKDNFEEIVNGTTLEYICTPEPKTKEKTNG